MRQFHLDRKAQQESRGRKAQTQPQDDSNIETAAFDTLTTAGHPMYTAQLEAALKLRGFKPHNLSTTLRRSRRIFRRRDADEGRYLWYVRARVPHKDTP